MKQETVVIVDAEWLHIHGKMNLVKLLIEFGAPITIDESDPEPIEVCDAYDDMSGEFQGVSWTWLHVSHQNIYQWFREVSKPPLGITVLGQGRRCTGDSYTRRVVKV